MNEFNPIELYKLFSSLSPAEKKEIWDTKNRSMRSVLTDSTIKALKVLYSDEYERRLRRDCIWRWMTKSDQHWRELANNVILFEVKLEKFIEFVWKTSPPGLEYPPLNWMKSTLTVERSLAWVPDGTEYADKWHESKAYREAVVLIQITDCVAEREESRDAGR